jgi:tetratricopeptide (TPR) repeat protein
MPRPQFLLPLLVVALLPTAASAQWQKNEYQLQKEHMAQFEPAPLLGPRRDNAGAPALVRIRFYADEGYRSGGARWADRMKSQLAEMNRVVGPVFGLRFEGESFRRWDRQGGSGPLVPVLEELERLDPGRDVDWVVGLCSPLPTLSMSFHDLGMARTLGKHFVLRGMSSLVEMQDFERIFTALDQADREKLYVRRKSHKEISVFLHEWAHTLGAPHVEDPTRIMSPGYSPRTSTFTVDDAQLIGASLVGRLGSRGRADGAIDWSTLRDHLASVRNPEWMASEVKELKDLLSRMGPVGPDRGGSSAGGGLGGALPVPVPPPPGLLGRPRLASPVAPAAVASTSPPPRAAAAAGSTTGKRAEVLAMLQRREEKLTGDAAARGAELAELAQLYAQQGAFSAAESALSRSGDLGAEAAPRVQADLQRYRRRFGVPADARRFKLGSAEEVAHADFIDEVRAALRGEDTARAQKLITAGLQQFPGSPGLLTLACETDLILDRARAAAAHCKKALSIMDDLPRAHYALGCAQANLGQIQPALRSLKRAIALDPKDESPWNSLAQLYRHLGRSDEYERFAAANAPPEPPAAPAPAAAR